MPTIMLPNACYNSCYLYRRVPFLRATNFMDFVDFLDFHKFVSPKNVGNPMVTWIAD